MKNTVTLLLAIVSISFANAQQGCAAYSLQKGDLLNFSRQLPPPFDPEFFKLKPKDQPAYIKKQNADIKSGALKLKEAKNTLSITDKQPTADGFRATVNYTLMNPSGTFVVPYVYECINDTLFIGPEQPFSQLGASAVLYTGRVAFPMKMKIGDLLPDNRNITIGYAIKGSQTTLMPYVSKVTTTHFIDENGGELYKTMENTLSYHDVTNNFSSVTTSETVYANREVTRDTTITYKGKTYKGFIIQCYLINKTSVEVKADYYQNAMQSIVNHNLAKAARKLAADENGAYTTVIEDVFVPELGVVSTWITKKDGSFFSRNVLTD